MRWLHGRPRTIAHAASSLPSSLITILTRKVSSWIVGRVVRSGLRLRCRLHWRWLHWNCFLVGFNRILSGWLLRWRLSELVGLLRLSELAGLLRLSELAGLLRLSELIGLLRLSELVGLLRLSELIGLLRLSELIGLLRLSKLIRLLLLRLAGLLRQRCRW